ncbi:MAG: BlaI/MecI/CopY family transcriptional regulator [Bacteroidetes bacterium]|nr:BlaI/MecI/CopY family transcriptional regulator [Bacteroidota bacterium]
MATPSHNQLSRRERQIMDIIYRLGEATAAEVMENLPDPPSYSAVRALMRILEEKAHLRHRQEGPRYVYTPTVPLDAAKQSALKHVLSTFFEGSVSQAVAALLDLGRDDLTDAELERLARLIDLTHDEGR